MSLSKIHKIYLYITHTPNPNIFKLKMNPQIIFPNLDKYSTHSKSPTKCKPLNFFIKKDSLS